MTDRFSPADLALLRDVREVRIVTGSAQHRTVIWVVVDDQDRVLVRSVRGPRGRWYREALAEPHVALEVGARAMPVLAQLANDPERIEATSQALRTKYGRSRGSLAAMLVDVTLPTTLELLPR
ncbi:MAG TPA: nitroreductase/quinone reductase family protein [Candidatus Dormibacteraeota bacterium]|nr:nitroreductase/quinone reductase family protein [Candidatus Dormibacteraeota bacterium]